MTAPVLDLHRDHLEAMFAHAARDYPYECCGLLFGPAEPAPAVSEVAPIRNIQDRLHGEDPEHYPRDSRIAYVMDPEEHLHVTRAAESRGLVLKGFYHSHPDHDVYFSDEDRRLAAPPPWDEPMFPGAAYVVMSVTRDGVAAASQFVWTADDSDYREVELHPPEGKQAR